MNIQNGTQIISLDGKHSPVTIDSTQSFLISPKSGFRNVKMNNQNLEISSPLLPGIFISAITKSKDGTVFCGTFDRGVLVVKDNLKKHYLPNELLLGIAVDRDNNVNISSRSRKLIVFENETPQLKAKTTYHLDYLFYPNNTIGNRIAGESGLFYADSTSIYGETTNIKSVAEVSDSILLVADGSVLREVSLIKNGEIKVKKYPSNYTVLHSNEGNIYASTKQTTGTLNSDYSLAAFMFKGDPFTSRTIASRENVVFFGTTSSGVLFFDKDSCVKQLGILDGLSSNNIKRLEYKDDKLFILTFRGFHIYNLEQDHLLTLDLPEGVVKNQTTNFTLNESELWLLEREAVSHLDINSINFNRTSGKLVVDSISFNGDQSSSDLYSLHHSNTSFKVYYDYRDILGMGEARILYRLSGTSEEWVEQPADKFEIEYNGLIPGEYSLEIKSEYRGKTSEPYQIDFKILPPVYLRWWFIVMVVILVFGASWFLIKRRIERIERDATVEILQERLKKNGLELNLKVLRAQMNPHFIFNSINSIQDLILKEETMKSYDSLVVFSQLVRRILEFSEQDFVTIKEEINFLEDYLALEKLRFQDDFSYEIINHNCPDQTKTPSLTIQPLVENVLKHGLLHKKGKKTLKVTFEIKSELVICKVKDNGIGLEASEKINARRISHKSFSTEAMEKRLSLLSNQTGQEFTFEIQDIKDEQSVLGAQAILTFPAGI
ncbi:MAG: histidine kinase [Flavobacteriales bacterium]|nr:histidine kinase [Flavobacteriales bacterium]